MLWTEKYKPEKIIEVIQQPIEIVKRTTLKNKPLLIYGPTGIGKTSAIHALAKDLDYEIYEINASNLRNKEQIKKLLGFASKQKSLFKKGKIILIDELEGLSSADRGAVKTIIDVIKESSFPIVLITNDFDLEKIQPIKKQCLFLEFPKLEKGLIKERLIEICKKEKLKYEEEAISYLARSCLGDLRSAINDLQTLSNEKITKESILNLGIRDKTEEINHILLKIFKTTDLNIAHNSLENSSVNLIDYGRSARSPAIFSDDNALIYWIDENLPRNYSPGDLEEAYNMLSKADVFQGRIRRRQTYRYLVYISYLISAGVANAKKEKPIQLIFKKTRRSPKQNFRLWSLISRRKYIVADKLSPMTRLSTKRNLEEIPYIKFLLKRDIQLQHSLEFDKQDTDFINKL